MPELKYHGSLVTVENKETTELDLVVKISEKELFISDPDIHWGKRYAFTLGEIEDYIKKEDSLLNFQVKPMATFSINDLKNLAARSPFIEDYINQYLQKNKCFEKISEKTLKEMAYFLAHSGEFPESDPDLIKEYSKEDIELLSSVNVNNTAITRGAALTRFIKYYQSLSDQEKSAINSIPGIEKILNNYLSYYWTTFGKPGKEVNGKVVFEFEDLFNLPADTCLGGTSGICDFIVGKGKLAHQLAENFSSLDKKEKVNSEDIRPVLIDELAKLQQFYDQLDRKKHTVDLDRLMLSLSLVKPSDDFLQATKKIIETAFLKEQQKYCGGFLGVNKKTAENYGEFLNRSQNHHYPRLLGLFLKEFEKQTGVKLNPEVQKALDKMDPTYYVEKNFLVKLPQTNLESKQELKMK